jgi:hypothetical protein
MNTLKLRLVILLLATFWPLHAFATSGQVTGRLHVYVNQGQYCNPEAMDCEGARFMKATNQTYQVIKQTRVELVNSAGTALGVSSTDNEGYFTINWTNPGQYLPGVVRVRWVHAHHQNRWRVAIAGDTTRTWADHSSSFNVADGVVSNRGNLYFVDSVVRQAYAAASRMWVEAVSYSGIAINSYFGIVIVPEDNVTSATFNKGPPPWIKLAPGEARYPLTVHHELGHALHFLVDANLKQSPMYNYPTACSSLPCNGTHGLFTDEWKRSMYIEALADFLGLVASYWGHAPHPYFCTDDLTECSTAEINTNSFDVETRSEVCTTFPRPDRREAFAVGFFWDMYDTHQDSYYNDDVARGYLQLVDRLRYFPNGAGNGQINESWNTALTTIDDADGGEVADYRAYWGTEHNVAAQNNCQP